MSNENTPHETPPQTKAMEQPTKQESRKGLYGRGPVLMACGVLAIVLPMILLRLIGGPLPPPVGFLSLLGPLLFAVGCVAVLRESAWGECSDFRCSRCAVLMMGLLMLVIGVSSLRYSFVSIFIFVGLPGLAMTLKALKMEWENHKKGGLDA